VVVVSFPGARSYGAAAGGADIERKTQHSWGDFSYLELENVLNTIKLLLEPVQAIILAIEALDQVL
jgi:hypothetical protein